jgi:hypothetical protein
MAVKEINVWDKHFPITAPKAFHNEHCHSDWPSIINCQNTLWSSLTKEQPTTQDLNTFRLLPKEATVQQEAVMIHTSNSVHQPCQGSKGFRKHYWEDFWANNYIWQLTFNPHFTLSFCHYPRIIHEHFSNMTSWTKDVLKTSHQRKTLLLALTDSDYILDF